MNLWVCDIPCLAPRHWLVGVPQASVWRQAVTGGPTGCPCYTDASHWDRPCLGRAFVWKSELMWIIDLVNVFKEILWDMIRIHISSYGLGFDIKDIKANKTNVTSKDSWNDVLVIGPGLKHQCTNCLKWFDWSEFQLNSTSYVYYEYKYNINKKTTTASSGAAWWPVRHSAATSSAE